VRLGSELLQELERPVTAVVAAPARRQLRAAGLSGREGDSALLEVAEGPPPHESEIAGTVGGMADGEGEDAAPWTTRTWVRQRGRAVQGRC